MDFVDNKNEKKFNFYTDYCMKKDLFLFNKVIECYLKRKLEK